MRYPPPIQQNKPKNARKKTQRSDKNSLLLQTGNFIVKGHLQAAERILKQLLHAYPTNPQGLCMLAELFGATGRISDGILHLNKAIQASPHDARLHYQLGILQLNQGNLDHAHDSLRRCIEVKPDLAEAHVLLGIALRRANKPEDAVAAYTKAISIKPDLVNAYLNLGVALTDLGRYQDAAEQYRMILGFQANHEDAHHGLALCMDWLGDLDQAANHYEKALQSNPIHIGSWNNIALVYLAQHRLQESLTAFRKTAELKHNHGRPINGPFTMILHRIRHDAEQLRYISAKTGISGKDRNYLQALTELETQHAGRSGTERIMIDTQKARRIAPSFNRILHRADCPEIPGGALNPEIDWSTFEALYMTSTPEAVTIDNFLRIEALQSLRKYCLESTVWKTVRPYGYMGTLIGDGFATPLLLQIITELRKRMPRILAAHHLSQAWSYKYDSTLRAINIHADCAAVNANFWITPDEANCNPDSGGLVFWDKPPPPDWDLMRTQNPDKTEIMEFLTTSGANAIKVPHRQNRMVLFNSALFHKSDDMDFLDGYENRRINVTLLFGNGLR